MTESDQWQEIGHARKVRRKLERLPEMRVKRRRLTWTTDPERRAAMKEWDRALFGSEARKPGLRLAIIMRDHFHSETGACWMSQETFAEEYGCDQRRISEGRSELDIRGLLDKEWGYAPTDKKKRRKVLLYYPAVPAPEKATCTPSVDHEEKADCTPSVGPGRSVRLPADERRRDVHPQPKADSAPTILEVSETQGFPRESLSSLPGAHLTRASLPHHHLRGAFRTAYTHHLDGDPPRATPQHDFRIDLQARLVDSLDSRERWPLTGMPR